MVRLSSLDAWSKMIFPNGPKGNTTSDSGFFDCAKSSIDVINVPSTLRHAKLFGVQPLRRTSSAIPARPKSRIVGGVKCAARGRSSVVGSLSSNVTFIPALAKTILKTMPAGPAPTTTTYQKHYDFVFGRKLVILRALRWNSALKFDNAFGKIPNSVWRLPFEVGTHKPSIFIQNQSDTRI